MFDFPKADPVPRGCGEREPGGIYAESGLSPYGRPLEEFLIDPPLPLPDGLDIINKPTLWQRMMPSGEPMLDEGGQPIFDLLIWVGAEHYEYCSDYIEETRRYGASRRLNPYLDLARLTQASRMILAHPHVINTLWHTQRPPHECGKDIPGHASRPGENEEHDDEWSELEGEMPTAIPAHFGMLSREVAPIGTARSGPCLFKLWELVPAGAAQTVIDELDSEVRKQQPDAEPLPLCLRAIGSTVYQYRPTGEPADGLVPGLFAALPITGLALIRFADGSVNEKAKQKVLAGRESHGDHALPWYESDR